MTATPLSVKDRILMVLRQRIMCLFILTQDVPGKEDGPIGTHTPVKLGTELTVPSQPGSSVEDPSQSQVE